MNVEAPLQELSFGEHGALREAIGETGRIHLDRWLPFLVIHRGSGDAGSLARRVAINSPAYLVWAPEEDTLAFRLLDKLVDVIEQRLGSAPLIFSLSDQPVSLESRKAPKLPRFVAKIATPPGVDTERAVVRLERGVTSIRADLRRCKVERIEADKKSALAIGAPLIALQLPSIHLSADGAVYPQLEHDLSVAFGDALLQTAFAYIDNGKRTAPAHYRALGRRAFLAAAKSADRKLGSVARSFDFLLSVSPINTGEAMERFLADKSEDMPHFSYRPLSIDPDSTKRSLYDIDLSILEDPLLERLLTEKRREIDQQLTMLATRNTSSFRSASTMLYGTVEPNLLDDALGLLQSTQSTPPRGECFTADGIAQAARDLISAYQALDDRFAAAVEVRDDVSGLMVSGPKLMIGSDSLMPAHRVDALLAHEVSIHLLTYFNGKTQGLKIFRSGLANYEGVQEGLGVFAEWAVGGLTRTRLRLLAGRVVAVDAMLRGGDFIEVFRLLVREHGFRRRTAFGIAARVFRSGGMAKDAIYLRGFRHVVELVGSGSSLAPFWLGKIAPGHAPDIEELLLRGLVHEPVFVPEFLARPDTRDRIARLRAGLPFQSMFNPETLPC